MPPNKVNSRAHLLEVTERRTQVTELVKQGMTDKDIAAKLGVSYGTIRKDLTVVRKDLKELARDNVAEVRDRLYREHEKTITQAREGFEAEPKPQWLNAITLAAREMASLYGANAPTEHSVNVMPPAISAWKVEGQRRMALVVASENAFYDGDIIEGEIRQLSASSTISQSVADEQ